MILPGTDVENIARERGILPNNFSWFDELYRHDITDISPPTNPIYLEHLSVEFIRSFKKEWARLNANKYTSTEDLIGIVKRGIRDIPKQSLSKNIKDTLKFAKILKNKMFCRK